MRHFSPIIWLLLLMPLPALAQQRPKQPPAKASAFIKGCFAYDRADYDSAMRYFKKAMREEPGNVKVFINSGLTEERLHDTAAALAYFQKALAIDPKYMRVYRNIASIYFDKGEYALAEKYYTKAIELEPLQDESYYDRSMIRFKQKQYGPALKDIYKAIKLKPDKMLYYYHRARIELSIGDYSRALTDINTYLAKNSDDPRALQTRAIIKRYYNDMQGAIADYTKAIELVPRSKYFYVGRSNAYTELGQYAKAIADCEKAEAIDQRYAEAYFFAGIAWMDSGRINMAVKMLTAAIGLDPSNYRYYETRGYLYQLLNDNVKAGKDFTTALSLNPYSMAYLNLSDIQAAAEDTTAAIASLDSVMKLRPYYPSALLRLGKLRIEAKNNPKAGDDIFRAVLKHTRDTSTLAFAYFYLGDTVLPNRMLNHLYTEAKIKGNRQLINERLSDLAYFYALNNKKDKFLFTTSQLLDAGFLKMPWLLGEEIQKIYPNDREVQALLDMYRKLLGQ